MSRTEVMNQILLEFAAATSGWYDALFPMAESLFLLLATLQLAWSAMWWMFERDDPGSMVAVFVRRVVLLAFAYALLVNFREWSFVVLEGFAFAGRQASGLSALDPSTVLDQGVAVSSILLRETFLGGLIGAGTGGFLAGIAGLIVYFAFVLVAVQMLITTVEAYFVLGAGVLFIGFAGFELLLPVAARLVSFAFGIGAKLFTVYLVVGVGIRLAELWVPLLEQSGQSLPALLEVLGAAVVYAFLAWSIPNLTSSAMNGAITLTMSDASFAASSAGRAGRAAAGGAAFVASPVTHILARVRNAAAPVAAAAATRVSSTASRVAASAGRAARTGGARAFGGRGRSGRSERSDDQ